MKFSVKFKEYLFAFVYSVNGCNVATDARQFNLGKLNNLWRLSKQTLSSTVVIMMFDKITNFHSSRAYEHLIGDAGMVWRHYELCE